jgi:Tfp pilus assembly protein PilX
MAGLAVKLLNDHRGAALVTALLLTLISLAISMALLSYVITGTKMLASQKRYRNALSAAHGAVEITTMDIIPKLFKGYSSSSLTSTYSPLNAFTVPVSNDCLRQKLNLTSDKWSACGSNATVANASLEPDFTYTLAGINVASSFTMKAKVVDTIPGNSDSSGVELDSGMAVAGASSGISPIHLPALITLEVEGTQGNNPQEKADLSVLYAY